MEKLLDTIVFNYSDPDISDILSGVDSNTPDYPLFFNQNEDSFIKVSQAFHVPSFSIHHDVSQATPSVEYLQALRAVIKVLTESFPGVFAGTRYFFDPAEVLRPCFIQIFKVEDSHYLYLLRPDLNIRLGDSEVITPATNDRTAEYTTEKMFFESTLLPINTPEINPDGGNIPINRLFRSTWIGETGTGYHLNGQWIDHEITKFISAAFLPENAKTYPYYPFRCDFNSLALFPASITAAGRKSFLGYLHKSLEMISADIPEIEESLKSEKFSRDLPLYLKIRERIPEEWTKIWSSLKISPYLNENDMREYSLEYRLSK
ncbi:MAG: hypothetical protein PQJ61_10915 [Spirochaetales bacterium]|uniref:Uncharacterized protein n=1 Tax=Candidatus Thalassospirochaeta sargassi TaxID=3119039 RepID=A0AAJ1IDE5_9SPIO|nr:hypothetical protein [Spirochaetales bacterium]